jgi:hypothetical protein
LLYQLVPFQLVLYQLVLFQLLDVRFLPWQLWHLPEAWTGAGTPTKKNKHITLLHNESSILHEM